MVEQFAGTEPTIVRFYALAPDSSAEVAQQAEHRIRNAATGVRLSTLAPSSRAWYRGRALVFQTRDKSSTLFVRSNFSEGEKDSDCIGDSSNLRCGSRNRARVSTAPAQRKRLRVWGRRSTGGLLACTQWMRVRFSPLPPKSRETLGSSPTRP